MQSVSSELKMAFYNNCLVYRIYSEVNSAKAMSLQLVWDLMSASVILSLCGSRADRETREMLYLFGSL